jgi:hypothetical protein
MTMIVRVLVSSCIFDLHRCNGIYETRPGTTFLYLTIMYYPRLLRGGNVWIMLRIHMYKKIK